MYTEENVRGRFPLRDVLLKAIIVIIFLILIIFIITKLTTPDNETNKSSSNYDKVFSENLEKMEDAAFKYYTEDRLPTEVGGKTELTLREMINQNLLEAFTDGNNEACDVNASYIRLTKNDNDYTLRVNLKCNEKEDYKLTRVGKYDYCTDTLCKRDSSKEKNTTKEEEKVTDEVDITDATTITNDSNISSSNNNTINNSNNSNYSDSFIVKLDVNGQVDWKSSIKGTNNENVYSVLVTNNEDYLILGKTVSGSIEADGMVLNNLGNGAGFLFKYSEKEIDSNISFATTVGGNGYDEISTVVETVDKGYIVGGYFNKPIDLGGYILNNQNNYDGMLIKYNAKDYEEAKRYLVSAYEKNPTLEVENLLALTYYELGNWEIAANLFNKIINESFAIFKQIDI